MAQKRRIQAESLSGMPQPNFLGYSPSPVIAKRDPTTLDVGWPLGQTWVNKTGNNFWGLTSVAGGIATWQEMGSSTGQVSTLSGNTGTALPAAGNIQIAGTTTISTVASGSTVTVSNTGPFALSTLTGLALGAGTAAATGVTYTPVTAWVPNLQINGSSTGITYSPTPTGFYQQIGSMVFFNANINLSSKGASTGIVTISNLPVSSGPAGLNNFVYITTSNVTFSSTNTALYGVFGTSNTVLTFTQSGTGLSPVTLSNAEVANNSSFFITGLYLTN